MEFDLILPITKADYETMAVSLPYIIKYLQPNQIVVIGSSEVGNLLKEDFRQYDKIVFRNEDALIDGLTFNGVKEKMSSLGG